MDQNYAVEFDRYSLRHYEKDFIKKNRGHWDKTKRSIEDMCKRIDNVLEFSRADLIKSVDYYKLVKLDFSVAGTKVSAKSSGNRCIVVVNEKTRQATILLIYSKHHICEPNETAKWKGIIKANFADYATIFDL